METLKNNYNKTFRACYLGHVVCAILLNLTPVLFTCFIDYYHYSTTDLGLFSSLNFIIQVIIAIAFSKLVDKIGFRPLIIFAMFLAAAGLIFYALTPFIFSSNVYLGLILATVVFSIAAGFFQILLSPIVNATPSKDKSSAMTKLHSFYSWGQIFTVLFSTLTLLLISNTLGDSYWYIIPLILCVVPIVCATLFFYVPLSKPVIEKGQTEVKKVVLTKFFIFALIFILCAGATEITMSQWASTYLNKVAKINKTVGDVLGVCMFAFMMAIGRLLHSKYSQKLDLPRLMLMGCVLAFVCYLVIALSPVAALSIIAFGLCGLGVALLWPGILSLTSQKFSKAGSWTLGILTVAGNSGAALGPLILGQAGGAFSNLNSVIKISGNLSMTPLELGLRIAVLICLIFPLVSYLSLLYIRKHRAKVMINNKSGQDENIKEKPAAIN